MSTREKPEYILVIGSPGELNGVLDSIASVVTAMRKGSPISFPDWYYKKLSEIINIIPDLSLKGHDENYEQRVASSALRSLLWMGSRVHLTSSIHDPDIMRSFIDTVRDRFDQDAAWDRPHKLLIVWVEKTVGEFNSFKDIDDLTIRADDVSEPTDQFVHLMKTLGFGGICDPKEFYGRIIQKQKLLDI